LLVVVSIIALLVSILLPVLGAAKGSAQSVRCASNLRQMMIGWEAAMGQRNYVIPNTVNSPNGPRESIWFDVLADAMGVDSNAGQFDAITAWLDCPTRRSETRIAYFTRQTFGYAVNSRWLPNENWAANEHQSWEAVRNPTEYVWFAEPALEPASGWPIAKAYFGINALRHWGVAYPHAGAGNFAFAAGDVRAVSLGGWDSDADATGTPLWLLNR
jgi:hypothetical protein